MADNSKRMNDLSEPMSTAPITPIDAPTLRETWPVDWDRADASMIRASRGYDNKQHLIPKGPGITKPGK